MEFMISHIHYRVASGAVLVGLATLTGACQRVPLLAPSGSVITLVSSVTALPVNGSTDIIAQVIEPAGTPPQRGTRVSFTTTLGSIQPSDAETDLGGQVVVKFLAGTGSGTATISAISGGAAVASTGALKILIGTAAVGSVRVSASPTLLPATGGSSTITAQALDINGNPLSSAPVSFSTTAGTLDQGFVTTDQSGTATTILRTSSQATVTAAVGAQGGSSTTPTPGTGTTPTAPTSGQASGTVTVNVSGAPTLIITAPTTPPSAGLPASFTFAVTASTTNGSAIRDVTVNWGDGGPTQDLGALTGTTAVSHTYQNAGTFPIVGTVTDSFGNVIRNSTSVTVNAKPQPVVSLAASTSNPTAGTDMTFTASVAPAPNSGTVIQNVTVNFGDGNTTNLGASTGTSIPLHHVYASSNTYTVTLTATDSNGGVGTAVTQVFVQPAPPLSVSVSATASSAGVNTTESFTATVTGLGNAVVQNYHWDFCGGKPGCTNGTADTTSNQQVRSYLANSGPITVSVIATTSDGRVSQPGSVVINP
jgi:hypothetical protein